VLTWQSPQHTCLHLFTSTVATPMGNGRTRYVTTCNSCFAVLIDYEG
jgi:hypothetical protein